MKHFFTVTILMALICAAFTAASADSFVTLEVGDSNSGVRLLQSELQALNYLPEEPDGVYGILTATAVMAFNHAHGITAGEAATLETCISLHRALEGNAPLDTGSKSSAVYMIQKLLYMSGFLSDTPDGIFGDDTKRASRAYMEYAAKEMAEFTAAREDMRRAHLLATVRDDGIPVAVDIPIINQSTVVTDGAINEDWMAFIVEGRVPEAPVVCYGDKGDSVARIQKRLIALGYMATGADGSFGENTRLALSYFQRRNGLPETGSSDWTTQQSLFAENAVKSDQTVQKYKAYVSTRKNKVYIVRWTGEDYTELVKTFTCTTGSGGDNATIKGTFHAVGQAGEWYYMKKSNIWVRYAFVINGNYFFHSVLFKNRGDTKPTSSSVNNLGKSASHGCVRLAVEDVQWIYENCSPGMIVVIE